MWVVGTTDMNFSRDGTPSVEKGYRKIFSQQTAGQSIPIGKHRYSDRVDDPLAFTTGIPLSLTHRPKQHCAEND